MSGHEKIGDKEGARKVAKIHIYRLLSNEVLYRPVPYAGELSEVMASLQFSLSNSECPGRECGPGELSKG